MTADKFNEKYKEWLEEGHYGLDIHIPEVIEYLDEKVFPFLTTIPGFTYAQIKEKFGMARFYINLPHTHFAHIISMDVEDYINKYLFAEQLIRNRKKEE